MKPARFRHFAKLRGLFFFASPFLAAGCATVVSDPPSIRAVAPAEPVHVATDATPVAPHTLPIDLDTVLRLTGENNPQIQVARAKLQSSELEREQVERDWLPALHLGMAYYRHEGGIQDQNGTFLRSSTGALWPGVDLHTVVDLRERTFKKINAERQIHQTDAELAKVTSENLVEAANTYFDLLAARTAEAILKQLSEYEKKVLDRAEALFKQQPSAEVLVEGIKVQTTGRQQAILQVRQQGDAASAKLAYLLGLGCDTVLIPVDAKLDAVELVDAHAPCDDLVQRALSAGPGVRELESLLAVVQNGIDKSQGPGQFIPTVEARMLEGGFGAGPNGDLTWGNRWDLGLQVRWNLTEFAQAKAKRRVAESRRNEIHLTMTDLRGKLTLGVRESQQTIESSRAQLPIGLGSVKHAQNAYRLSDLQLTQNVEGSSPATVMASIRGLEAAQLNHLNLLRAHNKAQVRLLVLTGAALERCTKTLEK